MLGIAAADKKPLFISLLLGHSQNSVVFKIGFQKNGPGPAFLLKSERFSQKLKFLGEPLLIMYIGIRGKIMRSFRGARKGRRRGRAEDCEPKSCGFLVRGNPGQVPERFHRPLSVSGTVKLRMDLFNNPVGC
jgi:hypothetical protein